LYSKYTIDILDNIGADIRVDLKGTDIIRVLPRLNVAVNDH
jgi:NADH dehydrogenase/NADH:ubiquinone oxidoreductase subunit G